MKLESVFKTSKTGLEVEFRSASQDEARLEVDYLKQLCGESPFLLSEPEEVKYTEEGERDFIKQYEDAPNMLMLNAYVNGTFAGNASFAPVSGAGRMAHRASLGIGLLAAYCGGGIGELMMNILLEKAAECGYEIMELDVFAKNERALRLYRKLGFVERGRLVNAVKYKDGSYDDEIIMQRSLK